MICTKLSPKVKESVKNFQPPFVPITTDQFKLIVDYFSTKSELKVDGYSLQEYILSLSEWKKGKSKPIWSASLVRPLIDLCWDFLPPNNLRLIPRLSNLNVISWEFGTSRTMVFGQLSQDIFSCLQVQPVTVKLSEPIVLINKDWPLKNCPWEVATTEEVLSLIVEQIAKLEELAASLQAVYSNKH